MNDKEFFHALFCHVNYTQNFAFKANGVVWMDVEEETGISNR